MIYLNPDSAAEQTIYLTLQEMKKDFATFTKYLVNFQSMGTREDHYFIGDVSVDNDRYTALSIFTNVSDALNGDILLVDSGEYFYKVWGQNSTTNLDPTNAAVVGMLELGTLTVAGAIGYTIPEITIPDNVIYYQ